MRDWPPSNLDEGLGYYLSNLLTARQTEVRRLLSEDFKNAQIATELDISIKTVDLSSSGDVFIEGREMV